VTRVSGRRLLALLVVLAAIGLPASVLQALCVGRSCEAENLDAPRVPFCPLPAALRELIANGYREGRSPDVLGVAAGTPVFTEVTGLQLPWPATASVDVRVPLVLAGPGIVQGAPVPDGVTLDRVAPTLSAALGFEREHPEVRSGTAIEGVSRVAPEPPRLILVVAWKGIGSVELEELAADSPFLASLLREGTGTMAAATGSLPVDPAATMTTIGTGALPSQHGITGSFVRNDLGEVVPAYSARAPVQIVATLPDDLDEAEPRTLVAVVGTDPSDRGLVGGGWYPDEDPVDVATNDRAAEVDAVRSRLDASFGADDVTDVLGVALQGSVRTLDRQTGQILTAARNATGGSVLVVVAGTGARQRGSDALADGAIVSAVEDAVPGEAPAVAATVPGGIFLDQQALTDARVSGQVAVDALLDVTRPDGREMMVDAFQGFAVSFARYC
jgi:type I phosphodiesterase/nucleotide pyrophosphatase